MLFADTRQCKVGGFQYLYVPLVDCCIPNIIYMWELELFIFLPFFPPIWSFLCDYVSLPNGTNPRIIHIKCGVLDSKMKM